jgi:hypothetical protein
MQLRAMAIAKWVLPVPIPPTSLRQVQKRHDRILQNEVSIQERAKYALSFVSNNVI